MYCHEEFTAQEIDDILREAARKKAKKHGHRVTKGARFVRASEVVFNGPNEGDPPPKIGSATVSWKDE